MGAMSNGDGSLDKGLDQQFERCEIHHNGDLAQPGYNHNLYLGGMSVVLRFCEIHHTLSHYIQAVAAYCHRPIPWYNRQDIREFNEPPPLALRRN